MSKKQNTGLKKVNSKSTELALTLEPTQENVPQLLDMVNAKLAALEGEEKETVRINEELEPFGKISDITDVSELMGAYAYVTKKAEAIESYRNVFEENVPTVKVPAVTINGHSVEKWQKEIMVQHRSATYKQEIAKLKEAKAELESCLSEKHKVIAKVTNAFNILKS